MVQIDMRKKTREQKIISSQRRMATQNVKEVSDISREDTIVSQFKKDFKKSALIVSLIIALEIILYFGTII